MTPPEGEGRRFRSRDWFADPARSDMTALYLERFMNYGLTPEELRSGRPIIGIAQTGSDLSPCNRIHLELARRVRDGIRDAGGIPIEFPVHPIFENCRRPSAALDRNLAYLGLVEILYGYPIDAVVLTTGCDKTTPAGIMAASTVDIPAIVLSGGPMLDGWHDNELVGSGTVIWRSRRMLAAGEIDEEEFLQRACDSAPSAGHCNTMGTASTMNAVAEALGLSLPGCAAIPAPYRERGQMAYATGHRIVEMAHEDLRPSRVLTRESFLNALAVVSCAGGSSNAQVHIQAMARHAGVELHPRDWTDHAYDLPLLVNMQPAGKYLGERFFRAGGVPAVMWELLQAGRLHGDCASVTGRSIAENLQGRESKDREVIRPFADPLMDKAGFLVLSGNLFDFGIMKTSVISEAFRARYLCRPGHEDVFTARAIVFDGAEDYHARINDPTLGIDEDCILVMRGAGPLGWPGSAEVVNMQPPDALIQRGIRALPTLGDGRQSGTADSPSILNASPESAAGGGLAWLQTGDLILIDLKQGRCDALVPPEEIARRRRELPPPPVPASRSPWEALYREKTGQLADGATLDFALEFRRIAEQTPRHNH
ncbi:dihydroxy-acid dehydratase family protein [Acidovorax sp. NCPPB 3859]|nr:MULTISPECIES: IlvD/Edd family dehydratase [unclassified Acidovorax]MDA8450037.1 dihydroxy-acid dehydratase family protein [Acidovorax sp. GBBC 3297]MDA8459618.1 dihydroxy-acid dehydratase family protein [Acidovorax sp. GBBC 3333]MDA8464519.1 dihydroxy-acid dehydratase family protein [Acidovorax sp. GBBC 3332]MDA8469688.1 dihydroxy-acid dehydratase family protein [Acidovorax sp. GBBC 3299]WCM79348.1 dihydroxy-acid dehydratase family protein [Acidovorax sp. GBBC 712]